MIAAIWSLPKVEEHAFVDWRDVRPATVVATAALDACQIPLDHIPPAVVAQALAELSACVRRHDLPFGIAHVLGEE